LVVFFLSGNGIKQLDSIDFLRELINENKLYNSWKKIKA